MCGVQFRVSDALYARIEEEAEAAGCSVARFAREACLGRTVLWANRRGMARADGEAWDKVIQAVNAMDEHDIKARAKRARTARTKKAGWAVRHEKDEHGFGVLGSTVWRDRVGAESATQRRPRACQPGADVLPQPLFPKGGQATPGDRLLRGRGGHPELDALAAMGRQGCPRTWDCQGE